jgi:hypothetical protein
MRYNLKKLESNIQDAVRFSMRHCSGRFDPQAPGMNLDSAAVIDMNLTVPGGRLAGVWRDTKPVNGSLTLAPARGDVRLLTRTGTNRAHTRARLAPRRCRLPSSIGGVGSQVQLAVSAPKFNWRCRRPSSIVAVDSQVQSPLPVVWLSSVSPLTRPPTPVSPVTVCTAIIHRPNPSTIGRRYRTSYLGELR